MSAAQTKSECRPHTKEVGLIFQMPKRSKCVTFTCKIGNINHRYQVKKTFTKMKYIMLPFNGKQFLREF